MKRFISVILTLIIIVITLSVTSCGSEELKEHNSDLPVLKVMIAAGRTSDSADIQKRAEITKYINESVAELGFSVEFIPVNQDDNYDTVKLLVSSGYVADIMFCYDRTLVCNYYPQGYTHNISNYLSEETTPYLLNYIENESPASTVFESGERWSIQSADTFASSSNIFIRKDWLDRLNLEIPNTVDELFNVLMAFKELPAEVTVTGQSVIPASFYTDGSVGPLTCCFLTSIENKYVLSTYMSSIGGTLLYGDSGYREYLRYLNKLYNNGLITNDFLVDNANRGIITEQFLAGRLGCFEMPYNATIDASSGSLLEKLKAADPNAEVISIPPLRNINNNQRYNYIDPTGGAYIFIPLTSTNPSYATAYLNWIASPEGGAAIHEKFKDYPYIDDFILLRDNHDFDKSSTYIESLCSSYPQFSDYVKSNFYNAHMYPVTTIPCSTYTTIFRSNSIRSVCKKYLLKTIYCSPEEFDSITEDFKHELELAGMKQLITEQENTLIH